MAFIMNNKFKEILEAGRNGNEKAKMVIQAMRKNEPQEAVDSLVNDYYGLLQEQGVVAPENAQNAVPETLMPEPEVEQIEQTENFESQDVANQIINATPDLTDILNKETEGLFDEDDVEDMDFKTFLGNKRKDINRQKKNADYFKIFDQQGRQNYITGKVDSYKNKFNTRLGDIEKRYNDMGIALDKYIQTANLFLDDGAQLDTNQVDAAYNEFLDDEQAQSSFGRFWDDNDNMSITDTLKILADKYGKENIIAALNTLKADNNSYKNYLDNQIDTNISKYTKNVENLLK